MEIGMVAKAKFQKPAGTKIYNWTVIDGNAPPPPGKKGVYYLLECKCGKQMLKGQHTVNKRRVKQCRACQINDMKLAAAQKPEKPIVSRARDRIKLAIELLERNGYTVTPNA